MGCFAMFRKYFLSLIAIIFISLPSAASAETKVGYFDAKAVMGNMPENANGFRKIENDFAGRVNAIRIVQNEAQVLLRDANYHARAGRGQEAQSASISYNSKKDEIAKLNEEYRMLFGLAVEKLQRDLRLKLSNTVRQIAEEEGFDLILTEGVYYSSPRIDITQKLIRRVSGN